jgi:hypothetical protein
VKFSERWRIAGVIASEIRFQGYLETNPSNLARMKEDPAKIAKAIKSASIVNTFMTTMILILIAITSIAASVFGGALANPEIRVAIGFSIYLLLSFVVLFFLNLTTTTGFFTSGVMRLPATLPLSQSELENLALLAFARVFIAPVIVMMTIYPVACLLIFGPIIAIVAFVACAATISLSIGSLIRVAKWFYRKTHAADESRLSIIARMAAMMGIVIGMLSAYSIVSYLPDLIRFIVQTSTVVGPEFLTVLALVFPFSFGFLASATAYGLALPPLTILASVVSSVLYSILAVVSCRKSGRSLRLVTLGGISTGRTRPVKEVNVRVIKPLPAMIRKDLKLASRSIGGAIVFVFPIFIVVIMYPMIALWTNGGVRSLSALMAVEYGNLFAGLAIVMIMMFDVQGASIHEGLPISTRLTLKSKTAIVLVPYICSMLLITIVLGLHPVVTPLILVIPLVQIPAGYAIAMSVGSTIYRVRGGGRAVAVNLAADQLMGLLAGVIAALVGIIPLVGYGIVMIATGSHILSLLTQLALATLEAMLAYRLVPMILKD